MGSARRRLGSRLGQALVVVVLGGLVVAALAACGGFSGGEEPGSATVASPASEPAEQPGEEGVAPAEGSAPPAEEPAVPPAETVDPEQLEAEAWEHAKAAGTVASYKTYLSSYPDGRFARKAEKRIASLRRDDSVFLAAERRGTLEAYETFLEQFPGHLRQAEARAALRTIRVDLRGRDVYALLDEGKIELEVRGSDITSVSVKVRRLTKHEVRVRIPAGTLFAAGSSSVQDMISLAGESTLLESKRWRSLELEAACADISAAIPGEQDRFAVTRASGELQRLARRLRSEQDVGVRQAAVWIVSDDADFFDLGTLIYTSGARVIGTDEAARAMKLVAEAGIDITSKDIWRDRQGIASGLVSGPLKKWLLQ
jgi:hypothetical protein